MSEQTATGKVKRVQLEAVVIRADGSRHDLGTISDSAWYWRGPLVWLANRRIRRANRSVSS